MLLIQGVGAGHVVLQHLLQHAQKRNRLLVLEGNGKGKLSSSEAVQDAVQGSPMG